MSRLTPCPQCKTPVCVSCGETECPTCGNSISEPIEPSEKETKVFLSPSQTFSPWALEQLKKKHFGRCSD